MKRKPKPRVYRFWAWENRLGQLFTYGRGIPCLFARRKDVPTMAGTKPVRFELREAAQ